MITIFQSKTEPETPSRSASKSPAGGSPRGRGRPRKSGPQGPLDDATKQHMDFLLNALRDFKVFAIFLFYLSSNLVF